MASVTIVIPLDLGVEVYLTVTESGLSIPIILAFEITTCNILISLIVSYLL